MEIKERPCKKVKISDEIQRSDRLSNLPDPIIHYILSLMNTKCAVRTCVLSKNWRYHWTNIHTLSFCSRSFTNTLVFSDFITHVLHRLNHLKLLKLKLDCWNTITRHKITSLVFEYAISHGFEELDTDMVDAAFPQILFQYQTLKTLKTTRYFNYSSFATLTTLQIYYVTFNPNTGTFAGCLNLQNLQLIQCSVNYVYIISAPRLLSLQISDFCIFGGRIVVNAPRLKFFNLNATNPLLLSMDECLSLDKVYIHLSPFMDYDDNTILIKYPYNLMVHYNDDMMQHYVSKLRMIAMCQGISHVKSLTLSLNLSHQVSTYFQVSSN
ncbi:hypothetical protein Dsin_010883 [Dipteronia sinensis]|uniref:F-box domain-containing protein n=1 Tax=Dipteronia sinensis TaxID=43782 RepID=A0AAE0ATD1_9ROSI|nr:hypothetical protein Dsin_010883 [Dipteronia sinensis]